MLHYKMWKDEIWYPSDGNMRDLIYALWEFGTDFQHDLNTIRNIRNRYVHGGKISSLDSKSFDKVIGDYIVYLEKENLQTDGKSNTTTIQEEIKSEKSMNEILIIDNSNIRIEIIKNFPNGMRFDYVKFAKNQLVNFAAAEKYIVGSKRAENEGDSFWKTLEGKGFRVKTFNRTNSEKGVDTELVMIGSDAMQNKEPGRLILMSGDKDMEPLIRRAHESGWKTEVWTWSKSINSEYAFDGIIDKVNYLDAYQDEYLYRATEDHQNKEYLGGYRERQSNTAEVQDEYKKTQSSNANQDEYTKRQSSKKEYQKADKTDGGEPDKAADAIGGAIAGGIGIAAVGVAAVALAPVEVPLIAAAAVLGGAGAVIGGIAGWHGRIRVSDNKNKK